MNTQEAFDIIWERAKDPRRSEGYAYCYYRHPNDPTLKCFVGACIPDEEYSDVMESTGASEICAPCLDGVDRDFLVAAQGIHDGRVPSFWKPALRELAAKHNLTVPEESQS